MHRNRPDFETLYKELFAASQDFLVKTRELMKTKDSYSLHLADTHLGNVLLRHHKVIEAETVHTITREDFSNGRM